MIKKIRNKFNEVIAKISKSNEKNKPNCCCSKMKEKADENQTKS